MEGNALFAVALILLLALLAGHLVKFLKIPEVTGYLVVGLALGPSALNLISVRTLHALNFFSEVATGLILFSIGAVFEWAHFQRRGWRVARLVAFEALAAGTLVGAGMLLVGAPRPAALLLATLAMATAPASTILVLREYDAAGPLTDTLVAVVAINNILALVAYGIVTTLLDVTGAVELSLAGGLAEGTLRLFWVLLGSASLGFLSGLLLAVWSEYVREHGETLILLIGSILLVVGAARFLGLSPLIGTLALGATLINLSRRSEKLFKVLQQTDPPIYALFFVIAGADLELGNLELLGLAGATYTILRVLGKMGGAYWGSRWLGMPAVIQRYLGFGLIAQAGLAIGLVMDIRLRYPEYAQYVATIILASIFIYELVGPVCTRYAILAAGEQNRALPGPKLEEEAEIL